MSAVSPWRRKVLRRIAYYPPYDIQGILAAKRGVIALDYMICTTYPTENDSTVCSLASLPIDFYSSSSDASSSTTPRPDERFHHLRAMA